MIRRITTLALLGLLLTPALARADAVQDWNAIMLATIRAQSPFAQGRFGAITELAVFEAVNACTGDYRPYLGTLTARHGASPEAAAIAAAHGVLKNYFPASAADLDAARATSLAAIPDGRHKSDGIAVGEAAAAAMIALRANDGSAPLETFLPASSDPGVWQPTPPAFGPGILLNWRNMTPFGIERGDQFRSEPPPALTSQRYRRDYDEVKTVGELNSTARPQDRSDVARFYAVSPPTQVWNLAAQQVSAAQHRSLSENARAFALINMAINDGLVAVFDTKYFYIRWRPVTAIRAGDADGNPRTEGDVNWTPFVVTPSFPGYGSAHGAASGAAREVSERVFGERRHAITLSHPGIPDVTLHYTNFEDITEDIDDARVYGGIHFRFDQEAGERQGRLVGSYVIEHHLRPVRHDHDHDHDRD
jgi:hypothetical protein